MMDEDRDPIEVLKFWHRVEFFVPFDLDEVRTWPNASYEISELQLVERGNDSLPWLSKKALIKAIGDDTKKYRYNLYLLPFDKKEVTQLSNKIFSNEKNVIKYTEFEEKLNDEGKTCFARLPLDSSGRPDFSRISISTLPWALGKLSKREFNAINVTSYDIDQEKLKSEFNSLISHINDSNSKIIVDHIEPGVLTASGIIILLIILKAWACYLPDDPIAVVFEVIQQPDKKPNNLLENQSNKLSNLNGEGGAANEAVENLEVAVEEDDVDELSELDISDRLDILNSFYIEDLEKVINHIANNKHETITSYINGTNEKINLYSKENYSYILEKLQSQYLNHGRWPSDSSHLMSLMQQFAINECFQLSNDSAIFSVNGPPGTGKTTLLQDIVAENIVRRAGVLAKFNSVNDAFKGKENIKFSERENVTVRILNDRLTGYEMLVASSNNAAVENISKELPLKRKLPKEYHSTCSYLASVACKVFAEHNYKNKYIQTLRPEEKPWGLISIALGNARNRNEFRNRVFFGFKEKDKKQIINKVNSDEYLTIWEWRNQYKGLTFQQAQENFHAADQKLQTYLDEIRKLTELYYKFILMDIDVYHEQMTKKIKSLQSDENLLINQKLKINQQMEEKLICQQQCQIKLEQHQRFKPNFWQRFFHTKIARTYHREFKALNSEWNSLLAEERFLKNELKQVAAHQEQIKQAINELNVSIKNKQDEYKEYRQLLNSVGEITLPPIDGNIENNEIQLKACWQNKKLNELRNNLFICAIKLHEAWLAEVLKNNSFSQNLIAISHLLGNKRPIDHSQEIYIWQSLFMWIPVISSTFASIARQFKNISAQQLGWLLIDEAGQAIPQAAVGAIWRAKQTLVVGDPLQIEPVFTTPPNLVEDLAKFSLKHEYEKWLPTLVSIQTLADDANKLGAYVDVMEKKQWIGCPLRIHRRCLDPMFAVANRIAYNNKMINARVLQPSTVSSFLKKSYWYDVTGEAIDKQYVQKQGEVLKILFAKLFEEEKSLPKIYIITPFKRIKYNLQRLIEDVDNWSLYLTTNIQLPARHALKKWCSIYIGTVHTFQGKEASTVILVLGVDQKNQGAANWASSKPNLLNVALTRARDRIFLIGDYQLWSAKMYFSDLADTLIPIKFEMAETISSHSKIY